jgi:hypothetical protein
MAGIPDMKNLRSFSLAEISSIMMNFNDASDNSWNRERVLERLTGITLPANLVPQLQTDWSPAGRIYWYTIESKNPNFDVMEQKSLEDWDTPFSHPLERKRPSGRAPGIRRPRSGACPTAVAPAPTQLVYTHIP